MVNEAERASKDNFDNVHEAHFNLGAQVDEEIMDETMY